MRKLVNNTKPDNESVQVLNSSCRCNHSCSNLNPEDYSVCLDGYLEIDSHNSVVGGGIV